MRTFVLEGMQRAPDIEDGDIRGPQHDTGGLPRRKRVGANGFHRRILGGSRFSAENKREPTCDGGANLFPVQNLAFDVARFEDVLGQGLKDSLRSKLKPKRLHSPNQSALPVTHRGEPGHE